MTEMERSIHDAAIEQTRQAAEIDGTKAVFFACTFWSGMLDPIAEAVPDVALLDPIVLPLKYLELLVGDQEVLGDRTERLNDDSNRRQRNRRRADGSWRRSRLRSPRHPRIGALE